MKKLFFVISVILIFYGCEKNYNNVIQPDYVTYQVLSVSSFTQFSYSPYDSTESVLISFDNTSGIKSVAYELYSPAGKILTPAPVIFSKLNEKSFSAVLYMLRSYSNGTYTIKYIVTDNTGNTKEAAVQNFSYNNGSANVAPVISDPQVDPDTAVVSAPTVLQVSLKVTDQDGLNDIQKAFFVVYKPDGTTSGTQWSLLDSGTSEQGDAQAGDGIFSLKITVNESNDKGTYRFEFRARDKAGNTSNIISYNVLIQ